MLTKVDEVFGVDVETLLDVGQVVRDVAFFVFSEKSSIPVDKLQVVSEVKRYTFWHVLSEIADEVEQGFKKHPRRRGNKGGAASETNVFLDFGMWLSLASCCIKVQNRYVIVNSFLWVSLFIFAKSMADLAASGNPVH